MMAMAIKAAGRSYGGIVAALVSHGVGPGDSQNRIVALCETDSGCASERRSPPFGQGASGDG